MAYGPCVAFVACVACVACVTDVGCVAGVLVRPFWRYDVGEALTSG